MGPSQFRVVVLMFLASISAYLYKDPVACYCNCQGNTAVLDPISAPISISAATKTIEGEPCSVAWSITIYQDMAFVCYEVEGSDGMEFTQQRALHHGKTDAEVKRIALLVLSAPDYDSLYSEMATMTQSNKERYCQIHGYALYNEDRMAVNKTLWATKAATRTEAYVKHLHKHEWMWWTDSDVVVTNANQRVEHLLADTDDYDFVCTKDWMKRGGQLNSGVIFLRNSVTGWRLLKLWRERMEKPDQLDDQQSLIAMLHENPDIHKRVKYLTQHEMNSYAHLKTRDGTIVPEPDEHGHDYYEPGDFAVHNVNCLRAWHLKEPLACLGIIGYYDHIFTASLHNAWSRRIEGYNQGKSLQEVFVEDDERSTRFSPYWKMDHSKVPNTSAKLLDKIE